MLLGIAGGIWIAALAVASLGDAAIVAHVIETLGLPAVCVLAAAVISAPMFAALFIGHRSRRKTAVEAGSEPHSLLLLQLLDSFPFGIQVKDADLRYVWVNAAHSKGTGMPRETLLGRRADEIGLDPGLARDAMAHDRRVLASGEAEGPVEQILRGRDGRAESFSLVTKIPLKRDGKVSHIVTVGLDTNALRQAEAHADTANRLVATILQNVPLFINVKDADLRFRWVNRAFAEFVGVEPASLIGKTTAFLSPSAAAIEQTAAHDRKVLETGQGITFSEPSPLSTPHHMLVTKAPILDADGQATHVLTIATDVTELNRLRSEADRAHRRLQSVLDALPMTITLKDRDRRYQWVNREFERVHGASADQIVGKRAEDIIADPSRIKDAQAADMATLDNGAESSQMQRHQVGSLKEERDFSVRRIAVRDSDGTIDGVLVVGVDVTEMLRANAEVDSTRRLLQQVVDNIPVGLQIKDSDRRIQWVNRSFERIFGVARADIEGKTVDEVSNSPGQIEEARRYDRHVLDTGKSFGPYETDVVAPGGERSHMLLNKVPLADGDGRVKGIMSVIVDITARKRVEAELQRLNELLERRVSDRTAELAKSSELIAKVIQSAPVPIVVHGGDGRITGWNPAAERLTGYTAADALGAYPSAYDREGPGQFAATAGRTLSGESFSGMEVQYRGRDGGMRSFLVSGAPLRRSDGTVDGAVAIWLDVTEQRAMERQLVQAQKMEAIGQLTGGIAHDFNNLLAVVIGRLDLLAELMAPNRALMDHIRTAIKAAEHGATLNKQLLAFARQQTLAPQASDLVQVVARVEKLLQRTLGETIRINTAVPDTTLRCMIDAVQFEATILNLALNARDAMPGGGTIGIVLEPVEIVSGQFASAPELAAGSYVRISVSDSGYGMAPEIAERCFDPFFTTKEVGKGTGLGLSMVYGFVKQSGGHVSVSSRQGEGTTFELFLPLAGETASTQAIADRSADLQLGNGELLLVVEDNPAVRATVVAILQSLRYRTIEAEGYESGLAALSANPNVALLVTDIIMPGGRTGVDLAEAVHTQQPGLKVLFISGYTGAAPPPGDRAWSGGEILRKPFRRHEFAHRLADLLHGSGDASRAA